MAKRRIIKRRLSSNEEFEVMKLVLDKVLWLGFIIMGYGFYIAFKGDLQQSVYYLGAGAVVLIIFAYILVKEFERIR
jgi:hypothetical protein